MGFATDCIHAGQHPDPTTGAVITPLYLTSTYVQEGIDKHRDSSTDARKTPPASPWKRISPPSKAGTPESASPRVLPPRTRCCPS